MISGIILAAGMSSRPGEPKQLLELEGRPILQHVIDAAADAGLDEIVIVLGHEAERVSSALTLPPTARVVVNPDYAAGQSTSLRRGLDSVNHRSHAATILLGDQPRVPSTAIRKMLDAFRVTRSSIVRARWLGTPGPPVVVARSEWPSFRRLKGGKGARNLISASSLTEDVEMGEPSPTDVDTWEQYDEIRRGSS